MSHRREFERLGYLVLDPFIGAAGVEALRGACDPLLDGASGARPGVRRVLHRAPQVEHIVKQLPIAELATEIIGAGAKIVRSILFDKTPETNWLVPWHQDATIAVREKREVEGFGPWSLKDGEPHCRPPRAVLDGLLVIRVHLDAVPAGNGPLRIIPGSHAFGLLESSAVDRCVEEGPMVECCTEAGGVVVMRPHTVHSSPKAQLPGRRRVLHIEWSASELPDGLEWAEGTAGVP
jgi:ectoine hydroxylase-related dioxygenase (phytanoyl-CoA dioxygenase family)